MYKQTIRGYGPMVDLTKREMAMFSHIILGVNDLEKSILFYDEIMPVLGHCRHSTGLTFAGYGHSSNAELGVDSLWINKPLDGEPATVGNGTNVAFIAADRNMVDAFHQKAIEMGAQDEGKPGIRAEAHSNFYAAYVRDPEGNKLVVVCHSPEWPLKNSSEE